MLHAFVLAALAQAGPGPLDAFRANLASIDCSMDFQCKYYYSDDFSEIIGSLNEFMPVPGVAGEPAYVVDGHWDSDGTAEHYVVRLVGGSLHDPDDPKGPLPTCELICNGKMFAFHYLRRGEILHVSHGVAFRFPLMGPFTWGATKRFDRELESDYAQAEVERKTGVRGGYRTEIEVYEKTDGDFRLRREIAYDPEIGYLPRFYRGIVIGIEDGRSIASVKDLYVVDAQPCTAGGFVPTELYKHSYNIFNFEDKYPDYDDQDVLSPSDTSTLVHFTVANLEERTAPVQLEHMDHVTQVFAPGGGLRSEEPLGPMTLGQLEARLAGKMRPSNRAMIPNIDLAELHEFDRPAQSFRLTWWLVAGFVVVLLGGIVIIRRRFAGTLLLLALIAPTWGCGQPPTTGLTAEFSPARLLYDAAASSLTTNLTVRNVGNQTVKVFEVDAGCSCRHVDTAQLPVSLKPGDNIGLSIRMAGSRQFRPQDFVIAFISDRGKLAAPASILTLPNHYITPQSVTLNGLYEGAEEAEEIFELIHRTIYDRDAPEEETELIIPSAFLAEKVTSRSGRVAGAPEYTYVDTTYRVRLEDTGLGLHRENIVLKETSGRQILEVPVIWQRLPFLSSTPERVVLLERPVRAFIRCPDQEVELTRVLSAPDGVNAVVSSPREVTVTLADGYTGMIDGFVEVGTTVEGRPPLRIRVVRYAPAVARSSADASP